MLSQMGIAIIACLSYNMLLGQGGMLSFGHAVYTGLGAFLAVHALNAVGDGTLPLPVSLIPLVGGLAGMFFAVLLGYVTTKKAGTHLRDDHAGHRRAGVRDVADVPGVLRRRGRRLRPTASSASRCWASPSGRRSRCTT